MTKHWKYNFYIFTVLVGALFEMHIASVQGAINLASSDSEEDQDFSHCRKLPSTPKRSSVSGEEQLDIVKLLSSGSNQIITNVPANITLILGNTGSGKTTLTQIIAGNLSHLHAVLTHNSIHRMVIIDNAEKIGAPSTISRTIIPELVTLHPNTSSRNNPIYFLDCPGFDDTRGNEQDLAANFYMNQIVKRAKRVNMIFLVLHSSVIPGNDRIDFDKLAQHATKFVRDLDHFNKSIGLVVTKVNGFSTLTNKPLKDKHIVREIVEFLHIYNQSLHRYLNGLEKDPDMLEVVSRKIKFVEILLTQDKNGNYPRISLSRNPEKCGPLSNSTFVSHTKTLVMGMFQELQYEQVKGPNSFGYTLKDQTIMKIQKYTSDINVAIREKVNQTLTIFLENFSTKNFREIKNPKAIYDLAEANCVKIERMSVLLASAKNLIEYTATLKSHLAQMGFTMPSETEMYLKSQETVLSFFDEVMGSKVDRSVSDWSASVVRLEREFAMYRDWYGFCAKVSNKISTYEFHSNKPNISKNLLGSTTTDWLDFLSKHNILKVESGLKLKAGKLKENTKWGKSHFKVLQDIMTWGLEPVKISCTSSYNVFVSGNFIKFTDFLDPAKLKENNCSTGFTSVEIYSADTVFFDANINGLGRELSVVVVSPEWQVVENVLINLDGANGPNVYPPKANESGFDGADGIPGKPGGPAGHFLGVGKHIDKPFKLTISAVGGTGGKGQDGGNGKTGPPGSVFRIKSNSEYVPIVWTKERVGVDGQSGWEGGIGGNGGVGGIGGISGKISIISADAGRINVIKKVADRGAHGVGGIGGDGGVGSADDWCYEKYLLLAFNWRNNCYYKKHHDGATGANGVNGGNNAGIEYPRSGKPTKDVKQVAATFTNLYKNSSGKKTSDFITWWK